MRYLVLSDLHSNWEALDAVLENGRGQYERIVCCGDLAGYGPDPNAVVDWARNNLDVVVRGNHDRACGGIENLEWFNPVARAAAIWTMARLSQDNSNYLRGLPPGPLKTDGFQLIHGSPLDEDEYVITGTDARSVFDSLDTRVTFFGHTHIQCGFARARGTFQAMAAVDGRNEMWQKMDPDGIYLINTGSVGQPRDGDSRAAYALFDSETLELVQRRVRYDFATTQRKIQTAGLPDILASRLAMGR
ncbi:MAG: metallophosphatase family protein [Acidobacteriota bacterium]|nr:metallophosphatase family protein [Acidobacteriota bacterium]